VAVSDSLEPLPKAIAWYVDTSSVAARVFLADEHLEKRNWKEAIRLLESARDILLDFETKTYAELKRVSGYQAVLETRAKVAKEIGREPTMEEISVKLEMSPSEYASAVEQMRSFRLAGESIQSAEEKLAQLKPLLQKLAAAYRKVGDAASAESAERAARSR
jgi:hypothetical protein